MTNTGQSAEEGEEAPKKKVSIENILYTLQFSYDRSDRKLNDERHGDSFFDYGYVGRFEFTRNPTPGVLTDSLNNPIGLIHVGYNNLLNGFVADNEINPLLASYNQNGDFNIFDDFPAQNGIIKDGAASAFGLYSNIGSVYNVFFRRSNSQYSLQANSSFDLILGSSDAGRHSFEIGIYYEQREDRFYNLAPRELWLTGKQLLNSHFNDLDQNLIIGQQIIGQDTIDLYDNNAQLQEQTTFDRNVRNALGSSQTEWIYMDEIRPDQLSLDMFSADELLRDNLVSYAGYNHLGDRTSGSISFNDYFTERDENGDFTRPIAPRTPVYVAGYIQDKFKYKDIIFRLGLRVDRFDANAKVLKDPYSLYGLQGASDYFGNNSSLSRPSTIGDDYAVYLAPGAADSQPIAYRDGDTWYNADGTQADPLTIFGASAILNPAFSNYDFGDVPDIKAATFDPDDSFEDYTPQVNIMPRLAFSFPISENAGFFAHYDVLTQRPPSNSNATARDYYFFNELTGIFDNPNLQPEKTIDYEVGFKQKVSKSSAVSLSAYYKEIRDLIQSTNYLYAFPKNYESFDNVDFSTVKGFSVSYDMRRTGNVRLNAAYTIQFADGTGSGPTSGRGLNTRGNLRVLFPLNFDERHTLSTTVDYRFGEGKKYNGPILFGKPILENFGVNLLARMVSGRPFTKTTIVQSLGGVGTEGGINQSRLPWNTTLNLRVDKDFKLTKDGAKRPMYLNVYVRVQNLLNTRNVLGVYSFTGSPEDDGWLSSPDGQADLALRGELADEYATQYNFLLDNSGFYSLPRRIFLGALFEF